MADDKKRKLPPKVAAMKAKKRRRVDGVPEDQPNSGKKGPKSGSRVAVKLDQLKWKSVPLNGRLEDAEGLCGFLEEISDVEVDRDEESGRVAFRAKSSAKTAGSGHEAQSEHEDDDGGEEWAGFSDDEAASSRSVANGDAKERSARKSRKTANGANKQDEKRAVDGPKSVFAGLEQDGEDPSEDVDTSAWKPLNLAPDIRAALSKLKFGKPTPIQKAAIPQVLEGKDVIGKASTGSGKTLAFGIPMLQQFVENKAERKTSKAGKTPLALILSPTRELAHQLDKHLAALCSSVASGGPSIATLTGGLSVQKQQRLLKHADIVIGTPGRLWEVISSDKEVGKSVKQIQYFVVDEADRLLSEGHFKEVEEIINFLDREDDEDGEGGDEVAKEAMSKPTKPAAKAYRQTLVFSATFDRGLQKKLAGKAKPGGDLMSNKDSLAYLLSKLNFRSEQPEFIDVNPVNQLATGLSEEMVQCEGTEKDLYLYTLLFDRPTHRTLVFANSIDAVRRLTPMLQNLGLNALALHSEMAQKARLRSVERFTQEAKAGKGSILIATDVAARGLDIPNVQTVIHYHLPRAADTYVHRSGRTARAGQTGSAIILCEAREAAGVRRLVAKVHAQAAVHSHAGKQGHYIATLEPSRRTLSQLKPRLKLAKRLADAGRAKQRRSKEDETLRAAAEELGQEYDEEEFMQQGSKGKQGRGAGRRKREMEAGQLSKAEMGAMRAELKGMLAQRINSGWSPRYLTAGGVDVDELLRERGME